MSTSAFTYIHVHTYSTEVQNKYTTNLTLVRVLILNLEYAPAQHENTIPEVKMCRSFGGPSFPILFYVVLKLARTAGRDGNARMLTE